MSRARTAAIARAQTAYELQSAKTLPTCGRGIITAIDRATGEIQLRPVRCHKWACPKCAPLRLREAQHQARAGHPERHIVLTLAPVPNFGLPDYLRKIRRAFTTLVQRLRREFGHFEYMMAFELQENGRPHIHALTRGTYIPWRMLSAWWRELTGAWMVHVKQITRTQSAVCELTKYLAATAAQFAAAAPGVPVFTHSRGWLIDKEDVDPAYSERDWLVQWWPCSLADLSDAAYFLGRSVELAPESLSNYQLSTGPPITPELLSEARRYCGESLDAALELCICILTGAQALQREADLRELPYSKEVA